MPDSDLFGARSDHVEAAAVDPDYRARDPEHDRPRDAREARRWKYLTMTNRELLELRAAALGEVVAIHENGSTESPSSER